MNISIKGTNVVVLYGDGAVQQYSDLINRWSGMISPMQWQSFQFILVGSKMPGLNLNESALSLVGNQNTRFFDVSEECLSTDEYYGLIYDKLQSGDVHLHLVTEAGETPLRYAWLRAFIRNALQVEALTTTCMYYLLFGRSSAPEEREEISTMLQESPGTVFLMGDMNESGGRVLPEDRWNAVEIALLMNSAEKLSVKTGAYSLGYSALNANGSELRLLRESAACRALAEELGKPIRSLSECDLYLKLLPEGVSSLSAIQPWLQQMVRDHGARPNPITLKNAWVTIRMSPELPETEAVRRMKRFADLNYAANREIRTFAKETAAAWEQQLRRMLCHSVVSACLAPEVPEEIARAFRMFVTEDPQPGGCVYPKKTMLQRLGKGLEEYTEQCRRPVIRSIQDYIAEKNISVFASEMAEAYHRLAEWLRDLQGEQTQGMRKTNAADLFHSIQKELDGSDAGNAQRLALKYKEYQQALENLHPDLRTLTEGITDQYYSESGGLEEKSWRKLVVLAGGNLERRIPAAFRGDFFRVLGSEFGTTEEREKFFDEYLRNGARMYRNLAAHQSNGTSVLLVDDRLTDQWFMQREMYDVHTDNAENLTVYPLGGEEPWFYLKDSTIYFKGTGGDASGAGRDIFSAQPGSRSFNPPRGAVKRENLLFGERKTGPVGEEAAVPADEGLVRLIPDEKNEYRLYWPWNRNDQTAMVEIFQFGERVGKVAVIPVQRFKENGENMNITSQVMEGKPVPRGMLTVTIRDSQNSIYIENAQVPGLREMVRYKVSQNKLQLKQATRQMMDRLVLRTTDNDGTLTWYPLYPADGEKPWLYEGLVLKDAKIVMDPTQTGEQIYAIRMD